MSSLFNPEYTRHVAINSENVPFHTPSQRSFESSRNYYEFLFSAESDDTEQIRQQEACKNLFTQEFHQECDITLESEYDPDTDSISTVNSASDGCIQNLEILKSSTRTPDDTNSDMSISSGSISSFENIPQLDNLSIDDQSSIQSKSSYDSMGFLDEAEIFKCFNGDILDQNEHTKWEETLYKKADESAKVDIIATYNIQNKYDHMLAAEMMMQQNFTFIALQEPHASHHRRKQGWSDFCKKELASARITAYETDLQIILYDNWKWGGKEISDFKSFQNGRIAAIAFGFSNKQKLGIISIYGITDSFKVDESSRKEIQDTRNTTTFLVKKIIKEWERAHPGIGIMIMGDLQETMSEEDSDNVGKYRRKMFPNGILKNTQNTHTSIVRDSSGNRPYITRVGTAGGRGIDHILIPTEPRSRDWFIEGTLDHHHSANFFPSDHSLLACTFVRKSNNNRTHGKDSIVHDYKQVFQIKVKRSGVDNDELILDETQFKGSRQFIKQQELFNRIQEKTANDSDQSNTYLSGLEDRIEKLYISLWNDGLKQKTHGKSNKLVNISENQALRLSHVTRKFNESVRAVMTELKLEKEQDIIRNNGLIRRSLHKNKGFKPFQSLPIPTKLRYIGKSLKHTTRKIQNMRNQLKRWDISVQIDKATSLPQFNFKDLFNILDSNTILDKAKDIKQEYYEEIEERDKHVSAIQHCEKHAKGRRNEIGPTKEAEQEDSTSNQDSFLNLDNSTVKLINHWLAEGECHQGFNCDRNQACLEFLNEESISSWKTHLLHWDEISMDISKRPVRESMIKELTKSEAILDKLQNNIITAQCNYKVQTLDFFISTNKISSFSNKVLPKNRDAPVPHSSIWDPVQKRERKCLNEQEEIIATGEHHNKWVSPSAAKESCAFAEIIRDGRLGPRGIKLKSNRKISHKDIPSLIHRGEKLPTYIKNKFIAAHGSHTASLFQEPKKDRTEFFYPFYLLDEKGSMNDEANLKEQFLKSIAGIPGKARHAGFQMAVLGRFGRRWQAIMFHLIKLMLIMRYVPPDLKKISRFPIPKPGRVGEYRPISLCHDMYCFLNGIITGITSKGIENARILHEGMTSYRRHMGCVTLVVVEQAFREDCIESGIPSTQIDEDEEKFFDRIPLEIILASMRVSGFPMQGFIEFKANCMDNKEVEIITNKGNARATFSCGLEQGNPDSPTVANLVILLKHKIWNSLCKDILIQEGKQVDNIHHYEFHIADKKDGTLIIKMMGYCDDNSRFLSLIDEKELILLTQKYINLTGDLSLVTKIGRKGSKSEIHFYNISASAAKKLKEIETVAWSFSADMPTMETVPFKLCLQKAQENELKKWIEENNDLSDEEIIKWNNRLYPEEHRHLGLTSNLKGFTDGTRVRVIKKAKKRIAEINSQKLSPSAQRLCNNMLCSTIPTYAPLQCGHTFQDLYECDKLVAQTLRRKRGLSSTDATHKFWIDSTSGGFGFKSFVEEDIISTARELEVVLNSGDLDSKSLRARLEAFRQRPDRESVNHVKNAIKKLGRYGIYLRDQTEEVLNYTLSLIARERRYAPVGNAGYKDGNAATIGPGKHHLLDLAMGGSIESIVRKIMKGESEASVKSCSVKHLPISYKKLEKFIMQAKELRFREATRLYKFWQWSYSKSAPTIPTNIADWEYVDLGHVLRMKYPKSYMELSSTEIAAICEQKMKIDFEEEVSKANSTHKDAVCRLLDSESPLLIATDGSHAAKGTHHQTSAAFVACKLKIDENESICDNFWEDRTTEPLIARVMDLPRKFGTEATDISHGECMGLWLQEASFDSSISRGIIMDSEAVRRCILSVRDQANKPINRQFIRKDSSGISKCVVGMFREAYNNSNTHPQKSDSNQDTTYKAARKNIWHQSLNLRLSIFKNQTKKWTSQGKDESSDKRTPWPIKYWDSHAHRPLFKVNSHQLNETGTGIKINPRYSNLTPKLSALNANHWADISAGLAPASHPNQLDSIETITIPRLAQRFFLTWGGMSLDKNIAGRFRKIFLNEKLKRLRKKPTQGLLWRLMPDMSTSWKTLSHHRGWLRSLTGFSNSHTRALYKSELYRNGAWLDKNPGGIIGKTRALDKINELIKCNWCNEQHQERVCDRFGNRIKGNRTHHMFFCNNVKLRSFRQQMDTLIERHINYMMTTVMTAEGISGAEKLLENIITDRINLHNGNRGRLVKPPEQHNKIRTANEWCKRAKVQTLMEGITQKSITYKEILGITPVESEDNLHDNFIGCGDAIMFGLIPKTIQQTIAKTSLFHDAQLPSAIRNMLEELMKKQWSNIQQLLIARISGLHKLMHVICNQKEKEWKQTHQGNLQIQSFRDIKKRRANSSPTSCKKRKLIPPIKIDHKRPSQKDDIAGFTSLRKRCSGISCRPTVSGTNKSKVSPNLIPQGKLHCQRCSKHQSALKVGAANLHAIATEISPNKGLELIQNVTHQSATSPNYTSLMNLLDNKADDEVSDKAKFKSKKRRVSDQSKMVCREIIQEIGRADTKSDISTTILMDCANNMKDRLDANKAILSSDIKHERAIIKASQETMKVTQKQSVDIINLAQDQNKFKENDSTKDGKRQFTLEATLQRKKNLMLTRWQLFSGQDMDHAMKKFRTEAESNVFIADQDAAILINMYTLTDEWQRFGRMFRSTYARSSKPSGVYMMPMFWGDRNNGHWGRLSLSGDKEDGIEAFT